jgi:hypothetical protein
MEHQNKYLVENQGQKSGHTYYHQLIGVRMSSEVRQGLKSVNLSHHPEDLIAKNIPRTWD